MKSLDLNITCSENSDNSNKILPDSADYFKHFKH